MNPNEYLNTLEETHRNKVEPLFQYMLNELENVEFSEYYAPNTNIPTFKVGERYVAIAMMKKHMTIHFSNFEVVREIETKWKEVKCRVGCVNISYTTPFKEELLIEAIRKTLK